MSKNGRPRVLLVKHWIDIHDRGLRLIASRCKNAGFEVVYASYSKPEEVVKMAAQEDVDVIGMLEGEQDGQRHRGPGRGYPG